jgi:hypothetical protein
MSPPPGFMLLSAGVKATQRNGRVAVSTRPLFLSKDGEIMSLTPLQARIQSWMIFAIWCSIIGLVIILAGIVEIGVVILGGGVAIQVFSITCLVIAPGARIMDLESLLQANRERDLWLKEVRDPVRDDGEVSGNIIFIPKGWCDAYTFAKGHESGPEAESEAKDSPPELYGIGPMYWGKNSPVQAMWFDCQELLRYPETSEAEARKLHPKMFEYWGKKQEK